MRHFRERRLEMISSRAQQDHVASGAVHVGQAGTMPLPNVANGAQSFARIEPTSRLVHSQSVKVRNLRKFLADVTVAAYNATAVAEHSHQAAMLPVAYLVFVRELELSEQVAGALATLRRGLDLRDKARPWPLL